MPRLNTTTKTGATLMAGGVDGINSIVVKLANNTRLTTMDLLIYHK